jgi:hypothetical protein
MDSEVIGVIVGGGSWYVGRREYRRDEVMRER